MPTPLRASATKSAHSTGSMRISPGFPVPRRTYWRWSWIGESGSDGRMTVAVYFANHDAHTQPDNARAMHFTPLQSAFPVARRAELKSQDILEALTDWGPVRYAATGGRRYGFQFNQIFGESNVPEIGTGNFFPATIPISNSLTSFMNNMACQ